jgi:hypothetical protein
MGLIPCPLSPTNCRNEVIPYWNRSQSLFRIADNDDQKIT